MSQGEYQGIREDPKEQRILFSKPVRARYIRLRALEEVNGNPGPLQAEISLIFKKEGD